jgi:Ca2+-binding EF-hand superfamily protein
MVVRVQLMIAVCVTSLLAPAALAQPDFGSAFAKLDADNDGVISFGELRYEGADAERYAKPVANFITDDGYGVELQETPFGIRVTSMEDGRLATREHEQARTYPRDVPVRLAPNLMLAGNPELRTMTPERFEREVREYARLTFLGLDKDGDGGVNKAEIDAMFLGLIEFRRKNPDFQSGPGGEAMRAHAQLMKLRFYDSLDLDRDGVIKVDELLEAVLDRMIAAFVLPPE